MLGELGELAWAILQQLDPAAICEAARCIESMCSAWSDIFMTAAQPTVVLIPGAWHSPIHYEDHVARLDQAGYPVLVHSLPTLNPKELQTPSFEDDAAYVRNKLLLPVLESGTNVLLVMHSYGGVPGSAAAASLNRTSETFSQATGRVLGLVYISSFVMKEGTEVHKFPLDPFVQVLFS